MRPRRAEAGAGRSLAALVAAAIVLAPLVWPAVAAQPGRFVDAVLAEADHRLVTASDVALGRALGLFGLAPSAAPIDAADVERLIGSRLILAEADRFDIAPAPDAVEAAWNAVAERLGGPEALTAWLARAGVERDWARAAVAADTRQRHFVDLRFRAFVFVAEREVTEALGAGVHDAAARARTRQALVAREVERRLGAWLREAEERASVRRLLAPALTVPCPLPMPTGR